MRRRRRSASLVLLLAAGLLAACGEEGKLEGTVVVAPGVTSTLTIEGRARTTLAIDQRGRQAVVIVDGPDERPFGPGASMRLVFEGPKTLLFRNEGTKPARVHYRATSPGGVSSSLQQP